MAAPAPDSFVHSHDLSYHTQCVCVPRNEQISWEAAGRLSFDELDKSEYLDVDWENRGNTVFQLFTLNVSVAFKLRSSRANTNTILINRPGVAGAVL